MDVESAQISWDRQIATLAATQHGVVSRAQILTLGLARGAIDRRLRAGRLHPVHRGVYAVGHPRIDPRGRWLAAVLACGSGAALSHRTAAALWGLRPSAAAVVDVTVPSRSGRRAREGMAVHRVPALPATEVTRCEGIPVTTPTRTLLDLAGVVTRLALERAIDRGEQLRIFDLGAAQAVLRRNAGRTGSRALSALLEHRRLEPALTRSELEERFLALCAGYGLPPPAVNVHVGGHEVDFVWRGRRLIIETDGRGSHATHVAFERDRARDAHLTALGYRVVRLTYRKVVYESAAVGQLLRTLLAACAGPSLRG